MKPSKILVFSAFHYDVAYRDTFAGYLPRSFEIIDRGLELLEQRSDFIFCIEQIILLDAYWQRRPEKRKLLKKHARDRRLIFCPGMWTMPDGNLPSAESCYRNVLLGQQWLEAHLGPDVTTGPICWMADIFGHHPQSPQIYQQCGYTLYMFERGQLETEEVPDFHWEGIDGTRLLTHWEADTYYGFNLGLAWLNNRSDEWIVKRLYKEVLDPISETAGDAIFTKVGGDFLVPSATHLEFLKRWNEQGWGPTIEFAHPNVTIAAQNRRRLKTLKADFNPLLQGTYSSRIRLKQANRVLENLAYAIEALGVTIGRSTDTDALWRGITKQQFHDIICGSLGETAWKEAIAESALLVKGAETAALTLLKPGKGKDTVIWNPLPYPRTEVAEFASGPELVTIGPMELRRNHRAQPKAAPVHADIAKRQLDNGLLRLELDEYGRLSKMRDLATGLVYEDKEHGYLHDVALEPDFGDMWTLHQGPVNSSLLHTAPYPDPVLPSGVNVIRYGIKGGMRGADAPCFELPKIEVTVAENGCRATLSVVYSHGCTVTYTLNAAEKLVRIQVKHKFGAMQRRLRAVIPTGIRKGTIRREVPAGWIAQPEGEYPAQNWLDYADRRKGLCLLNRGLAGNNVTDGVMLLTLYRAVALLEPKVMPDYELDIEQTADYALLPFKPGAADYDPTRAGRCFNQPLLTAEHAHAPIAAGCRFCLERGHAEIIGLHKLPDGEIELRLHDSSGKGGKVRVTASRPVHAVQRCTPAGKPLAAIKPATGRSPGFEVTLKPFEIATFRMKA